ncbi:hypothetical protein HER10_EVM0004692 [Colletotrichum scovillei]|uniref:uncharacterized protein n=1 Tax=Colletotrichum scovillei TaxID=1209932 RepID=UPI0015C2C861|nr:uncharacterized protein HER10_EVM0004692 [Colletotrichum scovillei]KAF4780941.1 hypothetical protein HER10_EVM0004692 [Colletotrichum scovillei]
MVIDVLELEELLEVEELLELEESLGVEDVETVEEVEVELSVEEAEDVPDELLLEVVLVMLELSVLLLPVVVLVGAEVVVPVLLELGALLLPLLLLPTLLVDKEVVVLLFPKLKVLLLERIGEVVELPGVTTVGAELEGVEVGCGGFKLVGVVLTLGDPDEGTDEDPLLEIAVVGCERMPLLLELRVTLRDDVGVDEIPVIAEVGKLVVFDTAAGGCTLRTNPTFAGIGVLVGA